MIFSPLPGRPLITQGFGQNPDVYRQFGFDGHNGIDFGVPVGTTVYAPHDGIARIVDDHTMGYGLHVIITDATRYSLLAHLDSALLHDGQRVYQGDKVALSGNSGMSTNPHLHWTYKLRANDRTQHANNGYGGAVDVTEFTRLWLDQDLHYDAEYTEFAAEYLAATFPSSVYLKNPTRIIG